MAAHTCVDLMTAPTGISGSVPPSMVDDVRIREVRELSPARNIIASLRAGPEVEGFVRSARATIASILEGRDPRLLVVVGPCSIHDVAEALQYARWVRHLGALLQERLFLIMRLFFEKPRTRSGWKGLVNDPDLDGTFRIDEGLQLARRLLLDINRLGVPAATEFVDPITPQYLGDLVSWAAIGARTSESPVHRQLASGLSCPVGFKNGTSGDVRAAVNGVIAAGSPQRFLGINKLGRAAMISTQGNPHCHVILRGGSRPNYDADSIAATSAMLADEGVCSRVMIDCSHGNCQGDYRRQVDVAANVAEQVSGGNPHICGLMIESNLVGGRQTLVSKQMLVPGMSITDACLGLDDTLAALCRCAGMETPAFAY